MNFAALPFDAERRQERYALDAGSATVEIGAVSLGNPHAVLQVAAVDSAPVASLGPAIEGHHRFPRRVNVGFMEVVDRSDIRLRVYERGAGETLSDFMEKLAKVPLRYQPGGRGCNRAVTTAAELRHGPNQSNR